MKREIKFRGKRLDNNEWVYGDLAQTSNQICIWVAAEKGENDYGLIKVNPETVAQYSGIKDVNDMEIYENDVVLLREAQRLYVVKFHKGCFKLFHADPKLNDMLWGTIERAQELSWTIEVVTNIHDNNEAL